MKIAVSNLDFNTSKEKLRAAFAVYGSVAPVLIDSARFTDQFRSLASVEMGIQHEATRAIDALNGSRVDGRRLSVRESSPKPRYGRRRHVEDRWWKRRV